MTVLLMLNLATPFDPFVAVNMLCKVNLDRNFFITKDDRAQLLKPKLTIGQEQYTRVEVHKKTVKELKKLCETGGFEVKGTGTNATKCLKTDYLTSIDKQFSKLGETAVDTATAIAENLEDYPPMLNLYRKHFNGIDNIDQRLGYMKSKIRIKMVHYKLRFILALIQTLFIQSAAIAEEYFLQTNKQHNFTNKKYTTNDKLDDLLKMWKKKAEAKTT